MLQNIKPRLPLIVLIVISISWAIYYRGQHFYNEYGQAKFEWLYFIDGLIVLPLCCWFCIDDKKQAFIKAALYCCLVVLIGSVIIPEQQKFIWHYLETGRYIVLAGFIILEIVTILTVIFAVKQALTHRQDPDLAIIQPIEKLLGKGVVTNLIAFETRLWTYALFAHNVQSQHFIGKPFSYHKKDQTQTNLLGFIMIMLFELPIIHILLHFIWSTTAANVISGLTVLGLGFFVAEYRAVAKRPISLTQDTLIIRYGVWQPCIIALSNINSIDTNQTSIKRCRTLKRYNLFGIPNVVITLKQPQQGVSRVYLGVDNPTTLINSAIENITAIKQ